MSESLAPCPAPAGTDPQAVADRITRASRSSFSAGMRLLPRPRREAMHAIYAFARILDDIADEDLPAPERHRLLAAWRQEVERVHEGRPVSAVGQALAEAVRRYRLPKHELLMLIEGMEIDAVGPVVAPTLAELRAYTRRVAGSVGLLSIRVFGAWRGETSERAALRLGDAFQLTNILRDIAEDAARGRLYLPRELLEQAGVPAGDPAAVLSHPALPRAAAALGARARADFAAARRAMAAQGRARLAPALMMMGVYEAYLGQMEAAGFRPDKPPSLSRARKLLLGLACLVRPIAPPG